MSDYPSKDGDEGAGGQPPHDAPSNSQPAGDEGGQFSQQVRQQQVTARVPESVARGVFSTGALLQQGNHEFVLDFLITVTRPHQIVARVILPPGIVPSTIAAMRQNIRKYTDRWGPPPTLPKPPQPVKPPPVEEIYASLKIPDDVLSGCYANAVMISHSPSEFVFDFITGFYPKSSVSCRVFMSAAQGPRLLESLNRSWDQYQRKNAARRLQMGLPPIDDQFGLNSPPGSAAPHEPQADAEEDPKTPDGPDDDITPMI